MRDLARDAVRDARSPSPDTSAALLAAFAERGIAFEAGRRVSSLHPGRGVAVLEDGTELPYDLFLGVPKHRAPGVVLESGMAEDGYVPVNSRTLETRFPGVYAVGDVATVGVPKAGVFSERQARVVAAEIRSSSTEASGRLRMTVAAPATSSLERAESAAWTSISSRGRSRRGRSRSRRPSSGPEAGVRREPPRPLVWPLTSRQLKTASNVARTAIATGRRP